MNYKLLRMQIVETVKLMVGFILEFPVRLKLDSLKSDLRELKRLSVHTR